MQDPEFQITNRLLGSPYSMGAVEEEGLLCVLRELAAEVEVLRNAGKLSPGTLEKYFGHTRFEQVAESNAIEGSTLSVGETELAIVKGVTLAGHDPSFVRDAISLDKALSRLVELARSPIATEILQVKELHELILDGHSGAGQFRSQPVMISGSPHRPPRTWTEVMDGMEQWETWSKQNYGADPLLRAVVLHAWFVHIHPFRDGNGRTARAISNLELIRAGYPSVVIRRRQDRHRYITALQVSDQAGDLSPLMDLFVERFQGAMIGLIAAARAMQGYDPVVEKLRQAQERRLQVWNRSVELLFGTVRDRLASSLEALGGRLDAQDFRDTLSLDEYINLCELKTVPRSWVFRLKASVPGLGAVERLAWIGFQNLELQAAVGLDNAGPAIYWSRPNPEGYPLWIPCLPEEQGFLGMTIKPGTGDEWFVLRSELASERLSTSRLGEAIAAWVGGLLGA